MSDAPTAPSKPRPGYTMLLVFLFLLVVAGPASTNHTLRMILVLGVLTTATWAGAESTLVRTVGVASALLISGLFFTGSGGERVGLILRVGYAFFVNVAVLRSVLHRRRVTADTVCGALACFLMLAMSWSLMFGLIEHLEPGSFSGLRSEEAGGMADLHYFSLVTITTLGYGDITPVSIWARNLAAAEALVGQFFLVVLVARLVALQIMHQRPADDVD